MTDVEIAVAHFLPDVWTPGQRCNGCKDCEGIRVGGVVFREPKPHDIPCPKPTWEIAGRLLEVAKLHVEPSDKYVGQWYAWRCGELCMQYGNNPIDAIIAVAAALARKEQRRG